MRLVERRHHTLRGLFTCVRTVNKTDCAQCLYGYTPFFQENRQKTKERILVSRRGIL